MNERLLKEPEVIEITSLSPTEINRREKAGKFPKRLSLGYRTVVWVGSEIDAWVQQTIQTARSDA